MGGGGVVWLPLSARLTEREAARIVAKLRPVGGGCWLWVGSTDDGGYARVWYRRRNWHLTRLLVWLLRGELVPPGREVDHVCRRPGCGNPAHLAIVDRRTNRAAPLAVARPDRGTVRAAARLAREERQRRRHLWEVYRYG